MASSLLEIEVLVVEDDEAYAELVRLMLAQAKDRRYRAHPAATLAEGLEIMRAGTVDLIILDLVLPDSSGLDTLEAVRGERPQTPVVVLTGMGDEELGRHALARGAAEYLQKEDVKVEVLLRALGYALERSRIQSELLSYQGRLEEMVAERTRELGLAKRHLEGEVDLRAQTERELVQALTDARQKRQEAEALLEAARAVMHLEGFEAAARRVFDIARRVTGATAGYVAMLSADGQNNEVLFLEAGDRPCSVDPDLPMPIRGLREAAYSHARLAWDNDFAESEWAGLMPEGHVRLDNVLFAPIVLEGRTLGIMGLANKEGRFDADDRRMAEALGEVASVALANSRRLDMLKESEERYRLTYDLAPVGIHVLSLDGTILRVNHRLAADLGYQPEELVGMSILEVTHPQDLDASRERLDQLSRGEVDHFSLGKRYLRRDGREMWVELTIALVRNGQGRPSHYIGAVKDVTARRLAEEALDTAIGTAQAACDEMHAPIEAILELARAGLAEAGGEGSLAGGLQEIARNADKLAGAARHLCDIIAKQTADQEGGAAGPEGEGQSG